MTTPPAELSSLAGYSSLLDRHTIEAFRLAGFPTLPLVIVVLVVGLLEGPLNVVSARPGEQGSGAFGLAQPVIERHQFSALSAPSSPRPRTTETTKPPTRRSRALHEQAELTDDE